MKRRALQFAAIAVSLLLALDASGQTPKREGSWSAALFAIRPVDGKLGRAKRLVAAGQVEAYCTKFSRAVPRLSPRESDWLNAEIKAKRFESVEQSMEFARRQSAQAIDGCLEFAGLVKKANAAKDASKESLHWARLAYVLANQDMHAYLSRLVNAGQVRLSKEDLQDAEFSPSLAQAILGEIVIDYMTWGSFSGDSGD